MSVLLAAGDPLFSKGVDLAVVLIVVLKCVLTFTIALVSVMLMVWFERRVIAFMANRVGPNRAGPAGLFQTVADGIKLFFKEPIHPDKADRGIYGIAPYLVLVPALVSFSVIPFSVRPVHVFGHDTYLQLADPPIGILLVLAMSSIAVYGVMLAGWASGSKYPLLGGVRASAQMVSYEAALGLSVAAVVLYTGSLYTSDIVLNQAMGAGVLHFLPNWNLVRLGVVPFVIFTIAALAEIERPPFDLLEAESELVAGFNTEYSSIGFALFYLASYLNLVTMSGIIVTLFLGGPAGPRIIGPAWLWGLVWFFAKLMLFLFGAVWIRGTLPRFRYDQLMDLGWKRLLPLSLGWLLLVASLLATEGDGAGRRTVVVGTIVVLGIVVYLALLRAIAVGRHVGDLDDSIRPTRARKAA